MGCGESAKKWGNLTHRRGNARAARGKGRTGFPSGMTRGGICFEISGYTFDADDWSVPMLLGIDVGTGGTRAVLVDRDGMVVASAASEHADDWSVPMLLGSDVGTGGTLSVLVERDGMVVASAASEHADDWSVPMLLGIDVGTGG